MQPEFSEQELEAYLEETLDPQRAAQLERAAANSPSLLKRLAYINGRRNAGVHTLGEIWRRNQVAVPTRETIVAFIDGKLPRDEAAYVQFRIATLKCRYTQALVTAIERERNAGTDHADRSRHDALFHRGANLVERRKPKR